MATFDGHATIEEAVRSSLDQTTPDFELIIVIDGSTDDTDSILAGLRDPRIHVLHQAQQGPSAARNRGADAARGVWLIFLDDDDYVEPSWLELFRQQTAAPNIGLASCGMVHRDSKGTETRRGYPRDLGSAYAHSVALFIPGAFAVRRDLFVDVAGYDPVVRVGENYELGLRLIQACERRGLSVTSRRDCPLQWVRRDKAPG